VNVTDVAQNIKQSGHSVNYSLLFSMHF